MPFRAENVSACSDFYLRQWNIRYVCPFGSLFVEYGYAAVFFVLVICGFGVPIPEDLTLVTGGVISGMGYTNPHIMFAVGMLGVLAGDGVMFAAGRIWGRKSSSSNRLRAS